MWGLSCVDRNVLCLPQAHSGTYTNPCAAAGAAAAGCAVLVGLRQVVVTGQVLVLVLPPCLLSVRLSWRTCRQHLGS